jgi:tRNA(Ile)-lysidine synthase
LGVIQQLLNHIERHNLCKTTDKILLAVSGGLDSMVMLDVFSKAGFTIGVVHCNFQLREEDSELDEAFVRKTCGSSIPYYSTKFDTAAYAEKNKISIQMAARELRYNFFEHVRKTNEFKFVATAHHLNDSLESALLNFIRGTGVEGVGGISVKNERIIRPLLFATRQMLQDYAKTNKIQWREDRSNQSNEYQRNFLRNNVVPLLKNINPNLEETFSNTSERLKGAHEVSNLFVDQLTRRFSNGDGLDIRKDVILSMNYSSVVLWEMIKDFGFNYQQAKEIVAEHQAGKSFHAEAHTLTVDRDSYLVRKRDIQPTPEIQIHLTEKEVNNGVKKIAILEVSKNNFVLTTNASVAQLDVNKIQFPLTWRLWKPGDTFIPYGMRQHKKLSDFFIDLKIPLPEKDTITVVESNGTIVWVVGYRIHDDYKITDQTARILVLEQQ